MAAGDDLTLVLPIALGAALVILLVIAYCHCKRKKQQTPADVEAEQELMRNDHLGNLNGLKRGDMEDLGAEKTKWSCGICGFHNTDEKQACTLCETRRGIALASSATVTERTNTIDVVQLNALQHAAWTRAMWLRTAPSEAAPTSVWALHPEFTALSTTATTYYTYTLVPLRDPSVDTTASDSDAATPSPTTPVALELVCVTPSTTPATVTVTGETIPDWYAVQVAQLRSLPFSLKYAWMLEQMAASRSPS
ncbi:hypothetical protein SDRG_16964 [Saprolegnia diclina VS20]|uniref:RanBP2-type domain-containing protein n=1 Tax=Saprolegnia diclina (strain VS20) TaxID=1156394 RepID=T0PVV1_SAPDV|nr:hypothetical protein SDRG_16964 [Saprolegnia diclina VS20]EQC25155.1 hypothetical protein SDRG_16964 [Saprolegnia diclina VS20]|eukprot:XP_008621412.1 hypothetical protein SDRG_16964 [Saprolegnia diclina VS20]